MSPDMENSYYENYRVKYLTLLKYRSKSITDSALKYVSKSVETITNNEGVYWKQRKICHTDDLQVGSIHLT